MLQIYVQVQPAGYRNVRLVIQYILLISENFIECLFSIQV